MSEQHYIQASDEQLAKEARQWDSGLIDFKDWPIVPEAVPRYKESTQISLRMPTKLIEILKAFAKREKIGYQVLMKEWLDDRIRAERDKLMQKVTEPQSEYNAVGISIRVPGSLHRKLVNRAAEQNLSLDAYVSEILSAGTAPQDEKIEKLMVEVRELIKRLEVRENAKS